MNSMVRNAFAFYSFSSVKIIVEFHLHLANNNGTFYQLTDNRSSSQFFCFFDILH